MSTDMPPKNEWRKKPRAVLSWGAAGTDTLKHAIAAITDSGNAIMFSRTIDGSALVLSIYSGTTKSKEYVTEPGEIVQLLSWAVETYA